MVTAIINWFKFRRRLNLQKLELGYLSKIPIEQQHEALIHLRFSVWVKQEGLKLDTIEKIKLRKAFRAGWFAKDWESAE